MLVLLTDQQHFSTCWPRVCTVPLEMSICTLACMITQNKKEKTIPSVQQWDLLGMKYTDVCASKAKQCMESNHLSVLFLWESKRKIFLSFAKKKRQNEHHFVMKTSARNPELFIMKQTFCTSMMVQLLQKLSDMLQPLWHKYSTLGTASF